MLSKPPEAVRILCAADLHLGRRLSSLPPDLLAADYAPEKTWEDLVAYVEDPDHMVDAVVLAGDIFDHDDDLFASVRVLEEGLERLSRRGIPVIAVAGNHDATLLRRKHALLNLPHFYFLGLSGGWESQKLILKSREIRFDGWSFSSSQCLQNPLRDFPMPSLEVREHAIGILHCDVQAGKESVYAPVQLEDFLSTGHVAWLLGHVHVPQQLSAEPFVAYCGSLQGLDPSETGAHGAWMIDLLADGSLTRAFIPLARLTWCKQELFLSEESLETQLLRSFDGMAETAILVGRFVLKGRTPSFQQVLQRAKELKGQYIGTCQRDKKRIPCYVDEIFCACSSDLDLDLLSRGEGLPAILARRLLALQGEDSIEKQQFLQDMQKQLRQTAQSYSHLAIGEELGSEELLAIGYQILDDLLRSKEKGEAP